MKESKHFSQFLVLMLLFANKRGRLQFSLLWTYNSSYSSCADNNLDQYEYGQYHCMDYMYQFEYYTIYHKGVTFWHDDILKTVRPFNIDMTVLRINSKIPECRVTGNLKSREVVMLAKAVGAKVLLPCHYHMSTPTTADPDGFN